MANDIKYPRICTTKGRHAKLKAEAKRRGMDIQAVAEEKFRQGEQK